jgi:hypothetical protein
MKFVFVLLPLVLMSQAFAHDMPMPPVMPKDFDTLKQLAGTWEGTSVMNGKEEKVSVVYEVTSGGTAVSERLMPGTSHEMVSMYYKDGKSLAMTHYCAMGNHPQLQLKNGDSGRLFFEMTKPVGVTSMKEPHMHAVTLTMADSDHLTQEWTSFADGKKQETAVFKFQRKK